MEVLRRVAADLVDLSHPFTAIGPASITPDPTIEVSDTAVPSGLRAIAVALRAS